ncbi:DUF373 family protein [Candidatus Woesearchaeota archaeon]|nr:DUF373 family protein [Candidatus Woesearchaeota archaeon]
MDNLLIVCVDRDNDLGKKTGINGPVIGREANLKAATALALADPGEADANCMFAAVKKLDELKKMVKNVELATLTGYGKGGFKSDKIINEQLDKLMKKISPTGFVLITDGAEDDQIIPILQSRANIVSKETVIVRQAQQIESAFFTIKEALKDPYISRIVFGIPGILLIMIFAFLTISPERSFQIIAFVLGLYLLLKGFGVEEPVLNGFRSITGSISVQRPSFPFYIGSLFILGFGAITAYTQFSVMQITEPLGDAVTIAQSTYLFLVLAGLSIVIGRCIDAVHLRRAFLLRKYLLMGASIILLWWILDAGTLVFLRAADLNWFLLTIVGSFVILLITFRLSEVMEIREKVTKLLLDLPIYTVDGTWLGKVESIDKRKRSIVYRDSKTNEAVEIIKGKFNVSNGKITVSS